MLPSIQIVGPLSDGCGSLQHELRRPVADRDAEKEAPREQVEGGRLLGHQDGVPRRQDQDAGAEREARHEGVSANLARRPQAVLLVVR